MLLGIFANSVFGVILGSPLALPDCTRDPNFPNTYAADQHFVCKQPDDRQSPPGVSVAEVSFPADLAPIIMSYPKATVFSRGGAVAGVEFETAGISTQDQVLADLTGKYGQPTTVARSQVTLRSGAIFTTIKAQWNKPDLWVEYLSAPVRIDMGFVTIETPSLKLERDAFYKAREKSHTPL